MKEPTILIVDDTPATLKVLVDLLKQSNFGIFIAQSGEQALQRVSNFVPDLILLDVKMPGIDGFATCNLLKQNKATCEVPVIFITALADTSDKIKGFAAGGVDYITKPFQHEEVLARIDTHLRLQRMRKELRELNATKDKFFSIIAHDLKNPFSGLMSIAEFLVNSFEGLQTEELRDCLSTIHSTSKRAFNLLENLLQWARSQMRILQCNPAKINIRGSVMRNIEILEKIATMKDIEILYRVEESINGWGDANMLDGVLRNLMANAVKYTPPGGKVMVTTNDEQELVAISVSDTGIGIKAQDLTNLFRIDVAHTSLGTAGEQGTGLGLILAKEFAEKNGGTLRVESEVGQGSTFTFTLPKVTKP